MKPSHFIGATIDHKTALWARRRYGLVAKRLATGGYKVIGAIGDEFDNEQEVEGCENINLTQSLTYIQQQSN